MRKARILEDNQSHVDGRRQRDMVQYVHWQRADNDTVQTYMYM